MAWTILVHQFQNSCVNLHVRATLSLKKGSRISQTPGMRASDNSSILLFLHRGKYEVFALSSTWAGSQKFISKIVL